jgi:membrane protein
MCAVRSTRAYMACAQLPGTARTMLMLAIDMGRSSATAHPDRSTGRAKAPRRGSKVRDAWAVIKETASDWSEDDAARLAASLAYYTLLSIAPLIVLAVAIAGLVFGEDAARGQIASQIGALVGTQAAQAIEAIARNANAPETGVVSSLIGIVVLLFGASGVFGELQSSLNAIWEVEPKPGRGVLGIVKDRFFSFTMVVGVAFLLLVSLVLSAAVAALGSYLSGALPGGEALWTVLNLALSIAIVTLLFALVFKVVPDVEIRWRDVWVGAFVTALLFSLGKFLIGLYLGKSSFTSSYGAAGSVVALVVWVYYTSQIVFLGAEFTQVYARRFGSRIMPSEKAVPAREHEHEDERPATA